MIDCENQDEHGLELAVASERRIPGMKSKLAFPLLAVWLLLFSVNQNSMAATYKEGGVTIDVGRLLTGTKTNTRYYGFTGGTITLPHSNGGMLSFSLWNDMQQTMPACTNYFNTTIGGRNLRIVSYATKRQILEDYTQFRGQWGPSGITRITLAVPPGASRISFDNQGSATGIELSHLHFVNGYTPLPSGYERKRVRKPGEPVIKAGRTLKGSKSGKLFYGYTGGTIFLPHGYGGYLSFNVYNDQGFANCHSALNKIHITVGQYNQTFTQYTSTLDLTEDYTAFKNIWGPAGGGRVIIQVPEGPTEVNFNNRGSQTGIEIADVHFSSVMPVVLKFEERVNRTAAVCKVFGRTLNGAVSGRKFYGFTSGRVILPNIKGGVLSFNFWNDQNVNNAKTVNQLNITAGKRKLKVQQTTTKTQIKEFYKEFMNQFGPAGGKPVSVTVPPGVSVVHFNNAGSQTGFELNNFVFRSN